MTILLVDAGNSRLKWAELDAAGNASVQQALASLTGHIRQRAPIYSALKQGGEPLYVKARRGEAIEAPERDVHVQSIEVLEQQPERLRLRVTCGSGTYIRSLARDLGEALGCGAHITALRRLWVEPFLSPRMIGLDELRAVAEGGDEAALLHWLLPLETGLSHFNRVGLDGAQASRFNMGQRLRNPDWPCGLVAVFDEGGKPLGLGQVDEGGVLSSQRRFNL